jgi:hypothetical protein
MGFDEGWQVEECGRVELLVREANQGVTRPLVNGMSLMDLWDQGGRRYVGDHWDHEPREGFRHETANKVMGVVVTHAAAEVEYSPRVRFTAMESADEARAVFLKARGGRKLVRKMRSGAVPAGVPGVGLNARQLACLEPISLDQYEVLMGQGEGEALLVADDFDLVNDQMLSRFAQDLYDLQWRRACGDAVWVENAVLKNGLGSAPILCEWDAKRHNVVLSNPHIKNVWIDPTARRIEDARYVIFDQVLSAEEACGEWPEFAALIEEAAMTGSVRGSGEVELGGPYSQTSFERKMVVVRTVWERVAEDGETGEQESRGAGDGEDWQEEGEEEVGGASKTQHAFGACRATQLLGKKHPHPNPLPEGEGARVRETVILVEVQRVISRRACPYWDIPMAMTVNIPIMYSAYGLGEPARLEDAQQLANRILSAISNLVRAGAYPQEYMPRELIEELEAAGVSPHASPNNIIPIDGANWERYFGGRGKLGFAVDAPQVNETFIRLVDMFLRLVDDLGGNVGVLQGRAPAGTSGAAIDSLTSNAKGPLALKSEFAEQALGRLARLILDMAIKYMPGEVMAKHFQGYSAGLLGYLRGLVSDMEFDVCVEIASGKGANKRIDEEQALRRLQAGAISLETAQEQMGVNVALERQRRKEGEKEVIRDKEQGIS